MNRRRAFTIVEVSISSVVVALMIAAAVSVAVGAHRTRAAAAQRAEASRMAFETLAEVRALPFPDPSLFMLTLGSANVIVLQNSGGSQLQVETEGSSLPVTQTALASKGWERVVRINFYNPATRVTTRTDTGILLIDVAIKHNGRELARAQTLESRVGRP